MRNSKNKLKTWLPSLLAVALTCLYPCVFLFSQNAGEANAVDMIPFFLIFLATAGAGLLICGLIFRNVTRAAFLTCIGMLAVINFSMVTNGIKKLLPWFQDRFFLLLVGLVLLGLLILFLRKKPNMAAGCVIVALTFGVLTVMSLINAAPKLLMTASMKKQAESQAENQVQSVDVVLGGEKRNVYYLLFDEYGGDENLETYFGFDNSGFYGELEQRGFSISHTSYNTESCWTDTLVPNLLNLDYVADDTMPEQVRREYLKNPMLFQIFRAAGYQINVINHRAYLQDRAVNELTRGQIEDNISEYLFQNSIYCKIPVVKDRIERWMFDDYRDHYQGPLEDALQALVSSPEAAEDGPTLTVSYIQCPHAPFVYNADGSVRDLENGWYWKDETLYPGQLQYVNSVILEAIDNIQREDPEAVILLQSDHGARVPLHMVEQYGGPRFDAEQETPVMQSVLCCACVPGQSVDIEGDTCINATRKVLNAAFDTSLELIPPREGYVLAEIYNAKPEPSEDTQPPEPAQSDIETQSVEEGAADGDGRDGSGKNGSGKDGSGRDGDGKDGRDGPDGAYPGKG